MATFDSGPAEALKLRLPIRIFLDPLTKIFDCTDYYRSIGDFVHNQVRDILQAATPESQIQLLIRLLVVENWGKRTWIVLDVNHNNYDWYTAHNLGNNKLAIYRVHFHKDEEIRDNSERRKA